MERSPLSLRTTLRKAAAAAAIPVINANSTTEIISIATVDEQKPERVINFVVGDKVMLTNTTEKTGKCRFIGNVPFSTGVWVGIELADDSGRNDGSVQGNNINNNNSNFNDIIENIL